MGIKTLSMSSSRILKVKQFLSLITETQAKKISEDILNDSNNMLIKEKLKDFNKQVKKILINI